MIKLTERAPTSIWTELNIPENGLLNKIFDKEEEFKFGLMVHIMKDIGLIQKLTTKED